MPSPYDMTPEQLQELIDAFNQIHQQVQEAAPGPGQGAWAAPAFQGQIEGLLTSEGMDPASYAQAKQQIAQGVGTMTGSTASDRARKGHVSRESMGQFMGGAPAAAAAKGLANLEAKKAQLAAKERERGQQLLSQQVPYLTELSQEPAEDWGEAFADYASGRPQYQMGVVSGADFDSMLYPSGGFGAMTGWYNRGRRR